jgi:ornithine decarboxylase
LYAYPYQDKAQLREREVIIAGPTCDSMDILYEWTYTMPERARIGDRGYILTAVACTQSYSSVYFNGFPPLASYIRK